MSSMKMALLATGSRGSSAMMAASSSGMPMLSMRISSPTVVLLAQEAEGKLASASTISSPCPMLASAKSSLGVMQLGMFFRMVIVRGKKG
jgi:hypothetical protein